MRAKYCTIIIVCALELDWIHDTTEARLAAIFYERESIKKVTPQLANTKARKESRVI